MTTSIDSPWILQLGLESIPSILAATMDACRSWPSSV